MQNLFKKLGGKKFTVWLVSCIFVALKVITPDVWLKITLIYIAAHGVQDGIYTCLKEGKHE